MTPIADSILKDTERFIAAGDMDNAAKCARGLSILTGNRAWERAYLAVIDRENPMDHVSVEENVRIPRGLAELLHALHDEHGKEHPHQSVRGGTQVNLTHDEDIRELFGDQAGRVIGIWSTRLARGGFHIPHIHPQGGNSYVLYIEVPDTTSGHLYFGVPRYVPMPRKYRVLPRAGMLVGFPNWLWHGVTEYRGDKPRLTIAFDTVPHG